jgi:hypothetical protein
VCEGGDRSLRDVMRTGRSWTIGGWWAECGRRWLVGGDGGWFCRASDADGGGIVVLFRSTESLLIVY